MNEVGGTEGERRLATEEEKMGGLGRRRMNEGGTIAMNGCVQEMGICVWNWIYEREVN